jgi:hypothetical protein
VRLEAELSEAQALSKRQRSEAAGRIDSIMSEVMMLVDEAGECRSGVADAMSDWAERVHDRDLAIRELSEANRSKSEECARLKTLNPKP